MLRRIGAEEGGEFKAVASGTLPSGKPVVVNADGTVSVVGVQSASAGSSVAFAAQASGQGANFLRAAYDSNSNKVVIAWIDGIGGTAYGKAIVGTVSGSTISFGSAVTFASAETKWTDITFDSNSNKIVIVYEDTGNSSNGTAIVGTVSGTSISFGSEVVFNAASTDHIACTFDSSNNKVVIAYRDIGNSNYGTAIVGTVSGTSISFGSEAVFNNSGNTFQIGIGFDTSNNKAVIGFRDANNSNYGTAIVGTVSGTSISFGSKTVFESGTTNYSKPIFDSSNNKMVIVYTDGSNSDSGTAIVGTVSGTSISFGTAVVFLANAKYIGATFDSTNNKIVVGFGDTADSEKGKFVVGTVSGTSISFTSEITFEDTLDLESIYNGAAFDSSTGKVVFVYEDYTGSSRSASAVVLDSGGTNITSENYIGMSRGVVAQTGSAASAGTPVVWEAADTQSISATFDSSSNKVVVAYMDNGNSSRGTYVVGTVSGTAISFGSPAVYTTGQPNPVSATFDSNSNKVVFCYKDGANSNQGTAIVGTVSGTSITFGSPVIFEAAHTDTISAIFDSNSNKIVISYRDIDNSYYGTAIVGTVSGTSISFGTAVVFESATIQTNVATFDSNSNKVVIGFRDGGDSNKTKAIVGTVSGTSISFGSAVLVSNRTAFGYGSGHTVTFDSSNNKVVFAYNDTSDSYKGYAIVGTVSGTSISFGSEVNFEADATWNVSAVFDSNSNKVNIAYRDGGNSDYGTMAIGTVSGTSISFATPVVYETAKAEDQSAVFDSSNNRVVVSYKDNGNSNHGTSSVFKNDDSGVARGEVAGGGNASVDVIGSVSDNQIGLTAGQQYFVQNDGTISTTADSPSVLAGTAISATELVVKT